MHKSINCNRDRIRNISQKQRVRPNFKTYQRNSGLGFETLIPVFFDFFNAEKLVEGKFSNIGPGTNQRLIGLIYSRFGLQGRI